MLVFKEILKGPKKQKLLEDFIYLVFEVPHYANKIEQAIRNSHRENLDEFMEMKSTLQTRKIRHL